MTQPTISSTRCIVTSAEDIAPISEPIILQVNWS